ncbi:MAG: hypothetical protein J2P26_03575, partial [Nocardiopsaceae bacterium]|nr:hypothetical protein [Nocardiopsaceae bacterium]
VIQICGLDVWITLWVASGETGDNRWTATGQPDDVHIAPAEIPRERTGPVGKKSAASWDNDVFPSFHSAYDFDFLT